ncbi:MAG: hypothetical protein V1492_06325 [Candidatus Micrarchaeota archaeon]
MNNLKYENARREKTNDDKRTAERQEKERKGWTVTFKRAAPFVAGAMIAVGALASCSDEPTDTSGQYTPRRDAGVDAGKVLDGGKDAAVEDGSQDAEVDGSADAEMDGGLDAEIDGGPADAAVDGSVDGGELDGGKLDLCSDPSVARQVTRMVGETFGVAMDDGVEHTFEVFKIDQLKLDKDGKEVVTEDQKVVTVIDYVKLWGYNSKGERQLVFTINEGETKNVEMPEVQEDETITLAKTQMSACDVAPKDGYVTIGSSNQLDVKKPDAGTQDASVVDAEVPDTGVPDAGEVDTGVTDTGAEVEADSGVADTGAEVDGGVVADAGQTTDGTVETDAGETDAGVVTDAEVEADGGIVVPDTDQVDAGQTTDGPMADVPEIDGGVVADGSVVDGSVDGGELADATSDVGPVDASNVDAGVQCKGPIETEEPPVYAELFTVGGTIYAETVVDTITATEVEPNCAPKQEMTREATGFSGSIDATNQKLFAANLFSLTVLGQPGRTITKLSPSEMTYGDVMLSGILSGVNKVLPFDPLNPDAAYLELTGITGSVNQTVWLTFYNGVTGKNEILSPMTNGQPVELKNLPGHFVKVYPVNATSVKVAVLTGVTNVKSDNVEPLVQDGVEYDFQVQTAVNDVNAVVGYTFIKRQPPQPADAGFGDAATDVGPTDATGSD